MCLPAALRSINHYRLRLIRIRFNALIFCIQSFKGQKKGPLAMNGSNFARRRANQAYDFIPPEKAPVKRGTHAVQRSAEIVDAEFEVINSPLCAHYRILNDNSSRSRRQTGKTHWSVVLFYAAVLTVEKFLARLGAKSFAGIVGASFVLVFSAALFLSGGHTTAGLPSAPATPPVDEAITDSNGLRIINVADHVKIVDGQMSSKTVFGADGESGVASPSITVIKLGEPVR